MIEGCFDLDDCKMEWFTGLMVDDRSAHSIAEYMIVGI